MLKGYLKKLFFDPITPKEDMRLADAVKRLADAALRNDLSLRLSDGEPLDPIDRLILANINKAHREDEDPKR